MRTTTKYQNPAQSFVSFHYELMQAIQQTFKEKYSIENVKFKNALIEIYDDTYRKMGFHTDQSLDLAEESFICLFSCYENASTNPLDTRKLIVQNKATKEISTILLEHNSAVLFSTSSNHAHVHKIILDSNGVAKNKWLGVTLRLSKTFVTFVDGMPLLPNGNVLRVASASERNEFYRHKSKENAQDGTYLYLDIDYTISESDLMPVK
jgi:hypothetical protein